MNSCILMAEVITNPELRKTPNDTDVANMTVEFPGLREEDPRTRIRVVGWGKVGVEMNDNFTIGDRVIIEGRLEMNVKEIDGYKEKRAELIVSHIYAIAQTNNQSVSQSAVMPSNVVNFQSATSEPELTQPTSQYAVHSQTVENTTEEYEEGSLDEIPF